MYVSWLDILYTLLQGVYNNSDIIYNKDKWMYVSRPNILYTLLQGVYNNSDMICSKDKLMYVSSAFMLYHGTFLISHNCISTLYKHSITIVTSKMSQL